MPINLHTGVSTPARQHCSISKMTYYIFVLRKGSCSFIVGFLCSFYMIKQPILHDCLKDRSGVDGTVMMWINSFLTTNKN